MKKYVNIPFTIGLVVWFSTAIYLSINSVVNLFINTDPYISKTIFSFSFLWLVTIGVVNQVKNGRVFDKKLNQGVDIGRTKCKTCKQKNGNT